MSEPIRLVKANPLPTAENYEALRKLGFEHIEKLGSALWTDYNTHDPGITMLEAVCYALTDLTYRTGWDMKDLLAPATPADQPWEYMFYTARQILHNQPLTINDYRKLLMDIDGVRNAWIEPSKEYEVPLFVNYNTIHPGDHDCDCNTPETPCYGSLTLNSESAKLSATAGQRVEADASLAAYLDLLDKLIKRYADAIAALQKEIDALDARINGLPADNPNRQALEQEKAELVQKQTETGKRKTAEETFRQTISVHKTDTYDTKILELNGLYDVLVEYEEDIQRTRSQEEVRQKIVDRLNRNRNLCEDFISVNEVEYEDFAVQLAIDLDEQADPDPVLAQVYYTIYQYFTPTVWHRTIDQMLERGWTVDELFEGPALRHGFIDDNELEATDLFRDLRLSDLINLIMDLPGVKAITRFYLTNAQGEVVPGPYFGQWVEQLQQERKIARLITGDCQVVFCKQRELISYQTASATDRRPARVNKLFADLKAQERAYKLRKHEVDLPVPTGEYMELADYYPVQYSLPACYGVKEHDEADSINDPTRKAQTLQLRGYLLVFEQLLADYLLQLDHLRDLFSFDAGVERTYFTHVLTEITDLNLLLLDHQTGSGSTPKPASVQAQFLQILEDLVEKPKQFADRRNRFLDHLLARFSEELTDYESLTRLVAPQQAERRFIGDKIALLQDYVKISGGRGHAFDYSQAEGWTVAGDPAEKPRSIENISGTERRIRRLLGMSDRSTRSLAPSNLITKSVMTKDKSGEKPKLTSTGKAVQVIQVINPVQSPNEQQPDIWLTSVEVAEGCCTESLMHQLLQQAEERVNYRLREEINYRSRKNQGEVGQFWYDLMDTDGATVLASGPPFSSRETRETAIKAVLAWANRLSSQEGLHLIEHILLRPRLDEVLDEAGKDIDVVLPAICLNTCDLGLGIGEGQDPTHRVKVSRLPKDKCYDNMPWKLEILERGKKPDDEISLLFDTVFPDVAKPPTPLKFKRYDQLSDRLAALRAYGSERVNYTLVNNGAEGADLRYGFIIHTDDPKEELGQSRYLYKIRKVGNNTVNEAEQAIEKLIRFFSYQLDWYCEPNPCDHNEDPFSFRSTVILPCWPKRFRDKTYRNLVEKTIQTQAPAHVAIRIKWVGMEQMRLFEQVYADWLTEMATNEVPTYEKVNPLVKALDTLQTCGHCEDDCGVIG